VRPSSTLASASAQYPYAGLYPGAYPGTYAGAGAYHGAALGGYHAAPVAAYAAAPVAVAAPVAATYAAAPVTVSAPALAPSVTSSQYRAQDEAGNTAFGYQNINSAHEQQGTAFGQGVTGTYSFVDEAGPHSVSYVADDLGFRVVSRTKRQATHIGAFNPATYAAAAAAAPSREAILTTIRLNPGHAIFYRVD